MCMIFQANPELRNLVYVDNMKLNLGGAQMDLPERTRDLYTLLKAEMKKNRYCRTTGNKKGTSEMEVSIPASEAKTSVVLLPG